MKFMMTYQIGAEQYTKAVSRFLETKAAPPAGVEMKGRWHASAGRHGFILLEAEAEGPIYKWGAQWHDVCDFQIVPVVEDEEAGQILASLR
jgi:hypothetical protein